MSSQGRFLFVHVQKTGGMSVDAFLREAFPDAHTYERLWGGKHAPLQKILQAHPEVGGYWIFGFVRNPWARMLSWHSMILRREAAARDGDRVYADWIARKLLWRTVLEEYRTFEAFVLKGIDDERLPMLRRPQLSFLRSRSRVADFIGRQESFDADLRAVCARLGVESPMEGLDQNRNPDPMADYRDAYSPEMRDKVGGVFDRDVQAFGYEF